MTDSTTILLVTGPAGIGKSTLCWEMQHQLGEAGIAHAIIETDELDRVYPRPTKADLDRLSPGSTDVSAANLAAIWANYRALGHTRLIMSGVMVHLAFDRAWILDAIPDAEITVVRLQAATETLVDRIRVRELGSGTEEQVERSLRQAKHMEAQAKDGVLMVPTDGCAPPELATAILEQVGWLPSSRETAESEPR